MADHFVKIYGSILDSSIWSESDQTVRLWLALLIMADAEGMVSASVGGLARRANISREACEAGLEILIAPDPDSKSEEFEGRRVQKIEGGWLVLNARKYRDMRTEAQVDAAERAAAYRRRLAAVKPSRDPRDASQTCANIPTEVEAEAEVKAEEKKPPLTAAPLEVPSVVAWIPVNGTEPKRPDRFNAPMRIIVPDNEPNGDRWANGGKAVREYGITGRLVEELTASFPGVDVEAELRGLVAWSRSNPTKRRTAGRMAAWLTARIGSRQDGRPTDRGGNGGQAPAAAGECRRCGGKGYVEVDNGLGSAYNEQTGRVERVLTRVPCTRCQGTGRF